MAESFTLSKSSPANTFTVCAVCQYPVAPEATPGVKTNRDGLTVTSPEAPPTSMVTVSVGSLVSTTV